LLNSPYLSDLQELRMIGGVDDNGAKLIGSTTCFRRLTGLDLHQNGITDKGLEYICNNPKLSTLRWLHLGSNSITDAGVEMLISSPYLKGLEKLNLDRFSMNPSIQWELNPISENGQELLRQHFSNAELSFEEQWRPSGPRVQFGDVYW